MFNEQKLRKHGDYLRCSKKYSSAGEENGFRHKKASKYERGEILTA